MTASARGHTLTCTVLCMASVTCPTCCHPVPVIGTPDRPEPLPDPTMELLVRLVGHGADTVLAVARALHSTVTPNAAQREAARRRLARAVVTGVLTAQRGTGTGGPGGTTPTRYTVA